MVVEDHHVVRSGLVMLLRMIDDFDVVAEAADGMEAMKQFRLHRPDVTLIDLRLPRLCGSDVIRSMRREFSGARFIALTAHSGEEDVYRAVHAGAGAYLSKGATNDELIRTIRLVHEGKSHFPAEIADILAARRRASGLTTRERDVLKEIVQGRSNREIATTLNISEGTVKSHVNRLLSKLGVTDRTQAVTTALQRGIVTLGPQKTPHR